MAMLFREISFTYSVNGIYGAYKRTRHDQFSKSAEALSPNSNMVAGLQPRRIYKRRSRCCDRHDHAHSPVFGLCAARGTARRDGALCIDLATRGLRSLWHKPSTGRGACCCCLADDGCGDWQSWPDRRSLRRTRRRHTSIYVRRFAHCDGRDAPRLSCELPESSCDCRFHHSIWAFDSDEPAQAYLWR